MGSLKKNNRRGWVVLLLIVMNIVSLSALWIGHSKRPGKGRVDRQGEKFLETRLSLTTTQISELRDIREGHFPKMMNLTRDFRKARERLHKAPRTGNNDSQLDELAAEVGKAQAKIEREIYDHFSQIRAICTEEQKEIFDKIMIDVLQRGERRGGPGNGPPPHRPSGPEGRRPGPGH